MADKYKGMSTLSGATIKDFTVQLASTVGTEAPWCTQFDGESFNKAGTNTVNLTMKDYMVAGTQIQGVKIGYLPTKNFLITRFSTHGTYYFTRTDDSLTFTKDGSTVATITKDQFRDGVTPHQILIIICGAGGGGGGRGSYCNGKDNFTTKIGGAGGGGGVAAIRLTLETNQTYSVIIGKYGSGGTQNITSEGSSSTTGGNGGTGGNSYVKSYTGTTLLTCFGGDGGTGGGANGHGTGGAGGGCSVSTTLPTATRTGGAGNHYGDHTRSGIAQLTFTPTEGTGVGSIVVCSARNNNDSSKNKSDTNGYFSGGCSLGYGVYFINMHNQISSGYTGQGGGGAACGACDNLGSGGAYNGGAYFYY